MSVAGVPKAPFLVVVPSGGAVFDGQRVLLDTKAYVGLSHYARFWPGRVRCLYRATETARMSYAEWHDIAALPFEIAPLPPDADARAVAAQVGDAAVLLVSGDNYRDLGVVDLLPNTRVVFIIENALRTRLDILRLEAGGIVRKVKTAAWLLLTERARRRDLARAAGLQANGKPAFDSYGPSNAQPFLYFDTRLRTTDYIGEEGAAAKAAAVMERRPLNLVYSGRLELLKGADHLVPIAARLKQRGHSRFMLHVFGDGSLAPAMAADIAANGLQDKVILHGPVDFDNALVPFLKSSADLFLCCHPQGDPSCTYLETLGCGVPIVGFANSALAGVVELGACGVSVPVGDRAAMVGAIERLDHDRARLAALTRGAAGVAATRLFEGTFAARVDHLRLVAGLGDPA